MTEREAKGFIQGKLDCMKKCGVFNKEDNINYNDCDYCNYCYSQGNFGQQKEAFNMAKVATETRFRHIHNQYCFSHLLHLSLQSQLLCEYLLL